MARLLALCLSVFAAASAAAADKITKPVPADQQLPHFVVPKGFEVELVAAEPLVINPITMTLDEQGRIYVSESHTYRYGPSGSPIKPFSNPIVRLEPDGKGYKRVLVAEGFDEPVMGLAIRGGKLWATANNFLYQFDLGDDGKATNKKTLLVDKNKAWNPFGMFVVEFGPDGLLYLSVGNHNIDIGGPTNRVSGRGSSGIVCRMKSDGSNLERLVHGLRVPYSFEYDPFGQLWLLSNGEGNPNRFVKVIEGVDYHCYSRGVDNNWLAGKHVLAPPCQELPSGANTQLIRYYSAGFPADYQGSLLLDNWGAHGFNGANRAVLRYVPDERGTITAKETFVSCTDPHFRPSHIVVDPNGDLLVADWYGRDDESDLTGRIWRVQYTGADKPVVTHQLDSPDWSKDDYALAALGSPHHRIREKAIATFLARGNDAVTVLTGHTHSRNPLGAAQALWVLSRLGTTEAYAGLAAGSRNPDWRVRRLALHLLRRHQPADAAELAKVMLKLDKDPAVRLEAALALTDAKAQRAALVMVLQQGAAADAHLRYEAACHLARVADAETFDQLLDSADADVRLSGLIAIDVACHENLPSKQGALDVLAFALEHSSKADTDLLLTLAQLNGDKGVVAALEKLVVRNDVPPAVTGRALLVLRAKAGSVSQGVLASAGKRFLDAVEKGTVKLASPSDQLLLLELLESEGPTPFAVKQVGGLLNGQPPVRAAAHDLARKFGSKAAALSDTLWPRALDAKGKPEDRLDGVATLARVEEAKPAKANWEKLLGDAHPAVRAEAVRGWRSFAKVPDMRDALLARAPDLLKDQTVPADDLAVVLRQLGVDPDALLKLDLPAADPDKDRLTAQAVEQLGKLPAPERPVRAALGRLVFERTGCIKCHTTVTQNTALAPSLKGIATAQKIDYLIESVLYPSKVIKTGFESELVVTKAGKPLTGLVKEEGDFLRILNADGETRVAKKDVDERAVQKVSVMPDGQEKLMSRQEFIDLIAYLQSLK